MLAVVLVLLYASAAGTVMRRHRRYGGFASYADADRERIVRYWDWARHYQRH